MDPNLILAELRDLIDQWKQSEDGYPCEEHETAAEIIVEHVEALDEWLSRGGFPPDQWSADQYELVGWVSVKREQFVPREGLEGGRFNVYRRIVK